MGRNKMNEKDKKGRLSVTISLYNFNKMTKANENKSKLINVLLEKHFNIVDQ